MSKLTYNEFKKAVDAGMSFGGACGCVGPQDNEEFCPCSMNILNLLTHEGAEKLAQEWRVYNIKKEEIQKPKIETIRDKRMNRMKELGLL